MNPSAGKHDASGTGSDSDVPMTSVSLKRRKGCSFATGIDHESVSQPSAAKRIVRNIIGARECFCQEAEIKIWRGGGLMYQTAAVTEQDKPESVGSQHYCLSGARGEGDNALWLLSSARDRIRRVRQKQDSQSKCEPSRCQRDKKHFK